MNEYEDIAIGSVLAFCIAWNIMPWYFAWVFAIPIVWIGCVFVFFFVATIVSDLFAFIGRQL